jgi:hypothetical protein
VDQKLFRSLLSLFYSPPDLKRVITTALSQVRLIKKCFSDRFQTLQDLSKKYPRYYSLWFGVKYLFVTDDPDIAQRLLTYPECVEKNFFMELFGFPNGLIAMKCKFLDNNQEAEIPHLLQVFLTLDYVQTIDFYLSLIVD